MRENTDQKNSEYGHFLRNGFFPNQDRIYNSARISEKMNEKKILILEQFTLCFTLIHQYDPRITYYNSELQTEYIQKAFF